MRNKKSQGLPLNIIILAVIGLIVLIVLIAIFTGQAGRFSRSVFGTCQEQGGICSTQGECKNPDFPIKIFAKGCPYFEREPSGNYVEKDEKKEGQCCLPKR